MPQHCVPPQALSQAPGSDEKVIPFFALSSYENSYEERVTMPYQTRAVLKRLRAPLVLFLCFPSSAQAVPGASRALLVS